MTTTLPAAGSVLPAQPTIPASPSPPSPTAEGSEEDGSFLLLLQALLLTGTAPAVPLPPAPTDAAETHAAGSGSGNTPPSPSTCACGEEKVPGLPFSARAGQDAPILRAVRPVVTRLEAEVDLPGQAPAVASAAPSAEVALPQVPVAAPAVAEAPVMPPLPPGLPLGTAESADLRRVILPLGEGIDPGKPRDGVQPPPAPELHAGPKPLHEAMASMLPQEGAAPPATHPAPAQPEPTPAAGPAWHFAPTLPHEQVAEGLASHAARVGPGRDAEFVLELNPPDLGKVHVHLRHTEEGLSARLLVADDAARLLIEGQLEQLRQRLSDAAVPVVRFSLGGLGSGWNPQQQQRWQQPRHQGFAGVSPPTQAGGGWASQPLASFAVPGRGDPGRLDVVA